MDLSLPLHRPRLTAALIFSGLTLSVLLTSAAPPAVAPRTPDEAVNSPALRERAGLLPGENLLFNGWGVTPAGTHTRISDMALKMVVSPDKKMLVAVSGGYSDTGLTLYDLKTHAVTQFLPLKESWNGLAFSRDGRRIFVSGGDTGVIHVFNYADGKATPAAPVNPAALARVARATPSPTASAATPTPDIDPSLVFLAGIAVHPTTGRLYVCNEANHEIWVLHPDTLALETTIPTGQHPHSCLVGIDRKNLYVSNWGNRSVSVIDLAKNRRLRDLPVGIHPNDLALAPDGRLFVACAGDNTVHVISTGKPENLGAAASPTTRPPEGAREIIATSLYAQSLEGSTPDALAVSPDGQTLFVANADNNNVMVVDISNRLTEEARERGDTISMVNGFIPVGWYPTAIAVSPDNQTLFVANGKGLKSRANFPATTSDPRSPHKSPPFDYIARTFEGSISAIAKPDAPQMAAYTEQVRKNSPYTPESLTRAPIASQSVIPAKVGDPCPIKYVLYIIKENRTYDQVYGDMKDAQGKPLGNGDPHLAIFGEKITPNQHQLARDYVLFDNLYSNSEVSVDGHSWCDAAIANDFTQRSWIISYSKHGKLFSNDELETPANGYLWDLCRRHGVTYKTYGEGSRRVPSANRGEWGTRRQMRDMDKVDFWIKDLNAAEKSGVLPRFTIMSLGENHTSGTTPGAFTPNAAVASNDLGLAKIVAAASRSKFWPEMAIFVIEDDTQNGPDHVDAHRTAGLVISPYVKRGYVDSTLYTTASLIRTMELILGLPPLTQYDAGATPMFNAFQREAVLTPYRVIQPQVDLQARNTRRSVFWEESSRMNFKDFDLAPEDELNRILWAVAKGDEPYPTPIHRALFTK